MGAVALNVLVSHILVNMLGLLRIPSAAVYDGNNADLVELDFFYSKSFDCKYAIYAYDVFTIINYVSIYA